MRKVPLPESGALAGKPSPPRAPGEWWMDDTCILDMDYFVKTISGIKSKGVRPDLIGSIIAHYASKWIPDLSPSPSPTSAKAQSLENSKADSALAQLPGKSQNLEKGSDAAPPAKQQRESAMAWLIKKRFFVETLIGILPPERDSVPCNFLLRLLRTSNAVSADSAYRRELEKRVSQQLEQACLKELMIPSFSHTCGTLLDVALVTRLVKRFTGSGAATAKVAKLVDAYLAEAAVDSALTLEEFMELAGALPSHARATDDALYRAIDTYLKAHPQMTKQERKSLCRLIDSRKLSAEASLHAAQNERLPVRAVIQVLFSEQARLVSRHLDWPSTSFSGARTPISGEIGPARCMSTREIQAQQREMRRLREDVLRLQAQCGSMQARIDKLVEKKSGSGGGGKGFFRLRRLGLMAPFKSGVSVNVERINHEDDGDDGEFGFEKETPMNMKTRLVKGGRTPPKYWRKSIA